MTISRTIDFALDHSVGLATGAAFGATYGVYQGLYRGIHLADTLGQRGDRIGRIVRDTLLSEPNGFARGAIVAIGYLLSSNDERCSKINTLITGIVTYFASKEYRLQALAQNVASSIEVMGFCIGLMMGLIAGFVEGFSQNAHDGYLRGRQMYHMLSQPGAQMAQIIQRNVANNTMTPEGAERSGKIVSFLMVLVVINYYLLPQLIEAISSLNSTEALARINE